MQSLRHIAVRLPNWIGDAVMVTPALQALRKACPQAWITGTGRQKIGPVLKNESSLDELLLFQERESSKRSSFFKEVREIRGLKPEMLICFTDSFSTALAGFLSRIPKRAGYRSEGRGFLFTHPIPRPSTSLHRSDKYLHLIHTLTNTNEVYPERVIPDKKYSENLNTILKTHDLTKGFIGINPNASASSRKWEPERFAETIRLLNAEGYKTVLFGSPEEAKYVHSVNILADNIAIDLSGQLSLMELIQIMEYCRVFLTNDSGPMHLAFSRQKPVIALEGAANVSETGHYRGAGPVRYINHHAECSPCVKNICPRKGRKYLICMKTIQAQEAAQEVLKMINENPSSS